MQLDILFYDFKMITPLEGKSSNEVFRYQMFLFVTSIFSFSIALALNDFVQSLFRRTVPLESSQRIEVKFFYLIILALATIIILYYLYKWLGI